MSLSGAGALAKLYVNHLSTNTDVQSQNTESVHFTSNEILPSGFAELNTVVACLLFRNGSPQRWIRRSQNIAWNFQPLEIVSR